VIALLIGAAATFAVQELRISGRDAALATADVRVTGLAELRDGLTAYRDYLNRELAQATRGQIRAEATLRHVAGVPITDGRHVGRLLTVETSGPTTRIVFERVADRWRVLALAPDPIVRVAGRADDGTRLARALRGGPVSGVTIVLARGEVVRLLVP
jgi:hypothetical protein